MRVTNSMMLASTLRDLNRSQARLQQSQADLTTGRTIRRASDDPARTTTAMSVRTELRRADQRARSLNDAQGWLGTADAALVSGLETLARVKELTIRASSSGISSPTVGTAIATEMSGIRDELLALANSQFLGRSIFNGTAAGAAYDAATGAYLGNDAEIGREIAAGTSVTVNLTGRAVFGDQSAPEGDLFAVIDRLTTAIAAGDMAAIAAEHANLDTATTRLSSAAAEIGSRGARLETVRARAATDEANLRTTLSELEDADLAEALLNVRSRENAYTAALQAAARIIPPSLVDYLR